MSIFLVMDIWYPLYIYIYIYCPEACVESTMWASYSLTCSVILKTIVLIACGMCFDLQRHKTMQRTLGQGRPLQASRLWIFQSWNF